MDGNLTFDDAAAGPLADDGPLVSGSFQPTIGPAPLGSGCEVPGSVPAPGPAGPYGAPSLAVFNGTDPNGTCH
jgi:hypothetical protein